MIDKEAKRLEHNEYQRDYYHSHKGMRKTGKNGGKKMTNGKIDERIAKLKARLEKLEAKKLEPSREERKAVRDATALLMKHGFRVKLVSRKKSEGKTKAWHKTGIRRPRKPENWAKVEECFMHSEKPIGITEVLDTNGLNASGGSNRSKVSRIAVKYGWITGMEGRKKLFRPPVREAEMRPKEVDSSSPSFMKRIFGGA
jgi:hypothetical protein